MWATVRAEEAAGTAEERWTLRQYDGLANVVRRIADVDKNDTLAGGVWTANGYARVELSYLGGLRPPVGLPHRRGPPAAIQRGGDPGHD